MNTEEIQTRIDTLPATFHTSDPSDQRRWVNFCMDLFKDNDTLFDDFAEALCKFIIRDSSSYNKLTMVASYLHSWHTKE